MLSKTDFWTIKISPTPVARQTVVMGFIPYTRMQTSSRTETLGNFPLRTLRNITRDTTELTELHVVCDRYDGLYFGKNPEGCRILLKDKSGCHGRRSQGNTWTRLISRDTTLETWRWCWHSHRQKQNSWNYFWGIERRDEKHALSASACW